MWMNMVGYVSKGATKHCIKDISFTPGMLYNAVKNYKATKDDEITVAIGAVVEVLQKSDNGWWLVRYLTLNI